MPLIRGHHAFDDHFAQIPNDWLRDDRLSLEARGLLAQIMSHRPGWNLSIRSISAQNGIGKQKVRRIIEELISLEYLERSEKQGKDEKGRMTSYDYITRDPLPRTAEPRTGKPPTGDRPTKNTIQKNTIEREEQTKETVIAFDEFWEIYPRKLGKGEAQKAFEKAVDRHGLDVVMGGVRCLASDPNLPDPQFIPRAATWLNGERWGDDPYPPKQPSGADRFLKPPAEIPDARAWVKQMHDLGEHFECRAGEFGCK
jgi:hypothetical protein